MDLGSGALPAGVINDEGALGAGGQIVGQVDAAGQFGGEAAPVDILTALEVVEDAGLAGEELAELGAEAVDGLGLQQGPDQQGAKDVGLGFAVAAAAAAQGGAQEGGEGVALESLS